MELGPKFARPPLEPKWLQGERARLNESPSHDPNPS